jgi:solute carrier family 25 protein 39/40
MSFFNTNKGKETLSMTNILNQVYRNEGIAGLFRGLIPRIAKVSPACGVMITSYEFGKSWLL